KGIHDLLEFFPVCDHQFIFSKEEYPRLTGAWQFGKIIRKKEAFDLFFCLPDSFSSALMGYAIAAKERVGFKKELRSRLLTRSYKKKLFVHRVEEYIDLLRQFTNKDIKSNEVLLNAPDVSKEDCIVININSEASSRRLRLQKAI